MFAIASSGDVDALGLGVLATGFSLAVAGVALLLLLSRAPAWSRVLAALSLVLAVASDVTAFANSEWLQGTIPTSFLLLFVAAPPGAASGLLALRAASRLQDPVGDAPQASKAARDRSEARLIIWSIALFLVISQGVVMGMGAGGWELLGLGLVLAFRNLLMIIYSRTPAILWLEGTGMLLVLGVGVLGVVVPPQAWQLIAMAALVTAYFLLAVVAISIRMREVPQ
jgi:hypothetical protein